MSLIFIDSFSHYDTRQIFRKWTTQINEIGTSFNGNVVPTYGRCGQSALQVASSGGTVTGAGPCLVVSPRTSFCAGAAVKVINGVSGGGEVGGVTEGGRGIFRFSSNGVGGNQRQAEILIESDLRIKAGTGSTSGSFGSSFTTVWAISSQSLVTDSWHYIEMVGTISSTVGTVQVWVDGVKWMDLSGLNTDPQGTGTWSAFMPGAVYGADVPTSIGIPAPVGFYNNRGQLVTGTWFAEGMVFCDLYLGDSVGDRKGDSRVFCRMPTIDGTYREWTPLTGLTHVNMIKDNPPDDDLSYVASSNPGDRDTYGVPAVDIASGVIYAVQVVPCVEKAFLGTRQVAILTVQGGNVYTGTSKSVADGQYLYYPELKETDPTGAPWSLTTANTDEFGVKLVS